MDLLVAVGVAVNILLAFTFWHFSRQLPQLKALFVVSCLQVVDFILLIWPHGFPGSIQTLLQILFYGHYFIVGSLLFYGMSFLYPTQIEYSRHIRIGSGAWIGCSVLAYCSLWSESAIISSQVMALLSIPLPFAVMCFYLLKASMLLSVKDNRAYRLRWVLWGFIAANAFTITVHGLMFFGAAGDHWQVILPAVYALLELLLFIAILQWVLLPVAEQHKPLPSPGPKKQRTTQALRLQYVEAFKRVVEQEKLYLDPDLKIQQVADKIEIPTHVLSEAINQELDITFQNLINQYRLEHVKQVLLSDEHSKLLDLAMEAGFGSKAAFNRAFKQTHGVSPSIWRAQQKSG